MAGDDSVASLYGVLVDRCLSLEASQVKLREEFDELVQQDKRSDEEEVMVASDLGDSTSYPVVVTFPGYFSTGTPFKNVLDSIGHAIHVSSITSGRITFCCAADKEKGSLTTGIAQLKIFSDGSPMKSWDKEREHF